MSSNVLTIRRTDAAPSKLHDYAVRVGFNHTYAECRTCGWTGPLHAGYFGAEAEIDGIGHQVDAGERTEPRKVAPPRRTSSVRIINALGRVGLGVVGLMLPLGLAAAIVYQV
ncbi:dsRNA-binding motif domain-containing protein [Devriesea agamarum]|uniref:hypothetical protein n=1 Tax=Devriesea agamarum TaxID=472569 RepID=UPI00071CB6D6|nr:hypothetical protein [Devriesea agamarum]